MPRKMNHRTSTEVLRTVVERRHIRAQGWSGVVNRNIVYPKLVDQMFGDGKLLIALTPTVSSVLNYYVVRIGTGWLKGSRWADDSDAPIRDHMDEIYEAIREQYGEVEYEDQGAYHDGNEHEWPLLDLTIGSVWGEIEWPFYPKRKVKVTA